MTTRPDYELLKDAYAIVDGIPDEAIAFGAPCKSRGRALDHGTICSPEGWIAHHPSFTALGLSITPDGTSLEFNGEPQSVAEAMAKVLHMEEEEAAQLFGERRVFAGDALETGTSDKQLWLTQIRRHIHDRAFSETLATMAMAPSVTFTKIVDILEGDPR